jgi:hypothetical protein
MDEMIQPVRTSSLLALAWAAVVLGIAWQPWRRGKPVAGGLWAGALALGGAYLIGQLVIEGWPPAFNAAVPKMILVGGGATLLGLLYSLVPESWSHWRFRAIPVLAILVGLFEVQITRVGVAWLAYLAVAGVAFWWLLDDLAERAPGASVPLILLPVVAATAPILFFPGNTNLAQFLVPLEVALGVCLVVAWCRPSFSLARGGTTVMSLLLGSAWLIGYFMTHVNPVYLLLLALPTAATWLTCFGPFRRLAPWQVVLLRFALVLVPAAVAAKLAYDNRPKDEYDPYAAALPGSSVKGLAASLRRPDQAATAATSRTRAVVPRVRCSAQPEAARFRRAAPALGLGNDTSLLQRRWGPSQAECQSRARPKERWPLGREELPARAAPGARL